MDTGDNETEAEAESAPEQRGSFKPLEPVTIKLRVPAQFGKDTISELTLKPSSRALKEFALPMDPSGKIDYQPYACAQVGVRMAGQPMALVDKLDPRDLNEVGQTVLGFLI